MDRRDFLKASAAATLTLAADTTWAQNAKTEIHWLGQATAKITTPSGKVIVIDPWLVNNPKTPADYKNLDKLGKVDVILVTHAHGDHVGTLGRSDGTSDTADLAKRTGAKVFGPAGLIQTMIDLGWVTGEQGVRFGKGGTVTPLGPQIKITQVRAEHSSELTLVDPTTKKSQTYPGGEPAGFIIEVENGLKIYHMGDTGLFRDAAYATREMLRPKHVIPIHYGTTPVLKGTPQEYQQFLGQTTTQVHPISPGDRLTF